MIKKIIVAAMMAIVLLLPQTTHAGQIGQDKYLHVGASTAIGIALAQNKPFNKWKPWQRALFNVAVFGGAKEWYDSRHPGHSASWDDIAADAVGAASAEGVVWFYRKSF